MLIPTDYNSHFSFPELAMFFLPQSFMFISDTMPNGQLGSVGATGHVELRDDWRDHGTRTQEPDQGIGGRDAPKYDNLGIRPSNWLWWPLCSPHCPAWRTAKYSSDGDIARTNLKVEVLIAAVGLEGWDVKTEVRRGSSRFTTRCTPLTAD
jgi:hypothetical protein